jgi:adenosylhomocysteine nucleosidase
MPTTSRRHFLAHACLAISLLWAGFARAAAPDRPLIAVLNAYPPEMDAMVKEFGLLDGGFHEQQVKGFRYYHGQVEGKDVVVFETGMSLVNAAMALQLALERLPITHVLFAGVAGGIDPALHVGDVVIPEQWAYHSEAAYFNPTPTAKAGSRPTTSGNATPTSA